MRPIVVIAALSMLAGCASNEYSKVPQPTGEWVPANPPSLMAAAVMPEPPRPAVWHRRPVRRVVRVHAAAAQ